MAGLKRRIRTEGWSRDVSDADEDQNSLLYRLSSNNKLWMAGLILVLVFAGLLMAQVKQRSAAKSEDLYTPPAVLAFGSYDDEPHAEFAADFLKKNKQVQDAHFADGKFVIIVPGDMSADNIEHLSLMVAQRNLAKFKNRIVVEVYQRSAATKSDRLIATAKWDESRYGFAVKFLSRAR